ncbi:hypothetical protein CTEN210_02059 [Chaetoceros tenuissimus]|uniref:Cell division cycle protein 123 n=1 Tax=Chaetoceros tenuissimus TaxID=426638 RepID=A0AAD3CJ42_9STRA|nr:hypothetical protein CTEN210_02059 [Chaetoceros tenuissimus]
MTESTDTSLRKATYKELIACQFSSWYPKFRALNKHSEKVYPKNNVTIRSKIISPLPHEFIEYLKSDGVVLPRGAEKLSSCIPENVDDWSTDDEHEHQEEDDDDEQHEELAYFPELNRQIEEILETLGPVMPKLNWSAPRDVSWLNESTLKCSTLGDVYLLLKSSDFCMFDLDHALDDIDLPSEEDPKVEHELVLRKWSNLHASMEFRCFVSRHELIAICQRNHTEHYPHLKKEYMEIRSLVMDFFDEYIQHNYADGEIENYIFDIYVDKSQRVWLLDFNLFSERTDALLFTWREINSLHNGLTLAEDGDEEEESKSKDEVDVIDCDNTKPIMRVVMNEYDVQFDPLASYRAPIDTVDLASDKAGTQTFKEFMEMCQKPSEMD